MEKMSELDLYNVDDLKFILSFLYKTKSELEHNLKVFEDFIDFIETAIEARKA